MNTKSEVLYFHVGTNDECAVLLQFTISVVLIFKICEIYHLQTLIKVNHIESVVIISVHVRY